jgi:L-fuconate dehydratase
MTKINGVKAHDVRFPTAAAGDGSDSINKGDYSATYVELTTDGPHTGTGFTFTNGRGNEITCAAVTALAHHVEGKDLDTMFTTEFLRGLTADVQLRWLGPEKGALHMATGALVNAVWDLRAKVEGKPMWQLLAEMPTADLVACVDFRHIDDALTPDEATAILDKGRDGLEDRLARVRAEGFPSYTTSVGWLGYPDDKVRALTQEAYAQGWRAMKMKVGGPIDDDVRRAGIIRAEIGPDALLMMDANQIWGVGEAIDNMARLAEFDPYWIEEPTHPDDVLGHARIQEAVAPIRVATGEVAANRVIFKQLLQADAIRVMQIDACRVAGIPEVLAELLLAAKFGVPVCPHSGGVGLCELVQHLAIFDYLRVGTSLDGRMVEYVDHLHEHFTDPVRTTNGRYLVPEKPGYSSDMRAESIAEYSFPEGPVWK